MYAVIFKAKINVLDDNYSKTSLRMRELAMSKYGCTEFIAVSENGYEIALSYWSDLEKIKQWKQDAEHLAAQTLGQTTWYQSYKVQIVEILREYSH